MITGIVIPLFYTLAFGGVTYVILQALFAGAETYSQEYTTDTSRQFEELFLFIPPERLRRLAWATSGSCFAIFLLVGADWSSGPGILRGVIAGVIAGSLALLAPRWLLTFLRHQRLQRFNEQLVDALVNMSNALKAGFSITQAFETVAKEGLNPISQEFSVMLQQTRVGVRFEDAMANLEKRVRSEDLTLMIRSIEIARMTGGNLTEVFEKIAATIRERIRLQGRIQSLTAQGKLQGIIVGIMPLLLIFALLVVDSDMILSFLRSQVGLAVLFLVTVLEALGALSIRKIIRIDV